MGCTPSVVERGRRKGNGARETEHVEANVTVRATEKTEKLPKEDLPSRTEQVWVQETSCRRDKARANESRNSGEGSVNSASASASSHEPEEELALLDENRHILPEHEVISRRIMASQVEKREIVDQADGHGHVSIAEEGKGVDGQFAQVNTVDGDETATLGQSDEEEDEEESVQYETTSASLERLQKAVSKDLDIIASWLVPEQPAGKNNETPIRERRNSASSMKTQTQPEISASALGIDVLSDWLFAKRESKPMSRNWKSDGDEIATRTPEQSPSNLQRASTTEAKSRKVLINPFQGMANPFAELKLPKPKKMGESQSSFDEDLYYDDEERGYDDSRFTFRPQG